MNLLDENKYPMKNDLNYYLVQDNIENLTLTGKYNAVLEIKRSKTKIKKDWSIHYIGFSLLLLSLLVFASIWEEETSGTITDLFSLRELDKITNANSFVNHETDDLFQIDSIYRKRIASSLDSLYDPNDPGYDLSTQESFVNLISFVDSSVSSIIEKMPEKDKALELIENSFNVDKFDPSKIYMAVFNIVVDDLSTPVRVTHYGLEENPYGDDVIEWVYLINGPTVSEPWISTTSKLERVNQNFFHISGFEPGLWNIIALARFKNIPDMNEIEKTKLSYTISTLLEDSKNTKKKSTEDINDDEYNTIPAGRILFDIPNSNARLHVESISGDLQKGSKSNFQAYLWHQNNDLAKDVDEDGINIMSFAKESHQTIEVNYAYALVVAPDNTVTLEKLKKFSSSSTVRYLNYYYDQAGEYSLFFDLRGVVNDAHVRRTASISITVIDTECYPTLENKAIVNLLDDDHDSKKYYNLENENSKNEYISFAFKIKSGKDTCSLSETGIYDDLHMSAKVYAQDKEKKTEMSHTNIDIAWLSSLVIPEKLDGKKGKYYRLFLHKEWLRQNDFSTDENELLFKVSLYDRHTHVPILLNQQYIIELPDDIIITKDEKESDIQLDIIKTNENSRLDFDESLYNAMTNGPKPKQSYVEMKNNINKNDKKNNQNEDLDENNKNKNNKKESTIGIKRSLKLNRSEKKRLEYLKSLENNENNENKNINIDQNINNEYKNDNEEDNLILLPGYCSIDSPFDETTDVENSYGRFLSNGYSTDNYARSILQYSSDINYSKYTLITHSISSNAALHLFTYYWSGLDEYENKNGFLIQSINPTFQGTPLMSSKLSLGLLPENLNYAECGWVDELSVAGSLRWLEMIPIDRQSVVGYYPINSIEEDCTWFETFCETKVVECDEITSSILNDPNDGFVESILSPLPHGILLSYEKLIEANDNEFSYCVAKDQNKKAIFEMDGVINYIKKKSSTLNDNIYIENEENEL